MANVHSATTIVDVAREAGVSRQTVTRALNGMADVSEATRSRVLDVARRLHYRPNRAAQALVRGTGVTIGFLVENFSNPFYAEMASALTRAAAGRGWNLILADLADDEARSRSRIEALLPRVDALILTGCREGTVGMIPLDELRGGLLGLPTVMLDGSPHRAVDAVVEVDHVGGVHAAIDHLVKSGRRNIGLIASAQLPGAPRHLAYRARLDQLSLRRDEKSEVSADETYLGGRDAADRLLSAYPGLDAILVYNDVMAAGALKALAERGIAVPDQVAVIGADGLEIGGLLSPELTTLSIDKDVYAFHAIDALNELMNAGTPSAEIKTPRVPLELTLRQSA
jgi:LacI family transcriptional regulator